MKLAGLITLAMEKYIYTKGVMKNMTTEKNVTRVCSECLHGIDIECATKFECELDGTIHYAEDTCDNYCEYAEDTYDN